MAHLNRAGRSRGQILLVAAFALGVIFIALAVVVNAAIFTENLATREEATSDADAVNYRHEVEGSVGHTIEYVNRNADNTTTESELETRITANITDINVQSSRQKAIVGRSVAIEYDSLDAGTRFENTSGTFQSDSGDSTWTVASSVSQTRGFVLNVSDTATLSSPSSVGAFTVSVNDVPGGPFWNMSVHSPSTDTVTVTVNNTDGDVATCTQSASGHFQVDVTGGTVAGQPCHALIISDGNVMWYPSNLSPSYNIRFGNADEIRGGYQGVIKGSLGAFPSTPTSKSTTAIYSLTARYTYQTPSLYYETDVRVAPGEPEE